MVMSVYWYNKRFSSDPFICSDNIRVSTFFDSFDSAFGAAPLMFGREQVYADGIAVHCVIHIFHVDKDIWFGITADKTVSVSGFFKDSNIGVHTAFLSFSVHLNLRFSARFQYFYFNN